MHSLAVALNVKNEAAVIRRCLESVAPLASAAVIVDTGSSDSTIIEVCKACSEFALKLYLYEIPWQDHAFNQTALLALARKHAEYVWVLDADETIEAGVRLPKLEADGYYCCRVLAGDWENWSLRIFASRAPWFYRGARHATPTCPTEAQAHVMKLGQCDITNHRDGGSISAGQNQEARFNRDVVHFQGLLELNPNDTRSAYYLAQSLRDAGRHREAMLAWERRANMGGGFAEEIFISLLQIARQLRHWYEPAGRVEQAFARAYDFRPSRPEAACYLAQWHNARGEHDKAYSWAVRADRARDNNDLFLRRRSHHTWLPSYELAAALRGMRQSKSELTRGV